jgi:hypothetical protein
MIIKYKIVKYYYLIKDKVFFIYDFKCYLKWIYNRIIKNYKINLF